MRTKEIQKEASLIKYHFIGEYFIIFSFKNIVEKLYTC